MKKHINKILIYLIAAGLIAPLAWLLTETYEIYKSQPLSKAEKPSTPSPQSSRSISSSDLDVKAWQIFGAADPAQHATQSSEDPDYDLPFEVTGLFFNNLNKDSHAIISVAGGDESLYQIGNSLPGSATLVAIAHNFALVKYKGKIIKMELKQSQDLVDTYSESKAMESDQSKGEDDIRSRVLSVLNLEPVSQEAPNGYRVTEDSKKIMDKYNLEPGDIIVSANGYPIGDAISDQAALKSFQDTGEAEFLVRRNSTTLSFIYNTKTLVSE